MSDSLMALATSRRQRIAHIYDALNAESIRNGLLSELYHPAAVFQDPFHRIDGLLEIEQYFAALYQSVTSIHFDYGHYWPGTEADFLRWTMTFSHPAIGGGKSIQVDGGTELVWRDDQIIHHRDIFDGAQMLYDHLPMIGWALRKVRERMA